MGWRDMSIQGILQKIYNKDNDIGCFIEADVQFLKELQRFHRKLLFLPKRMKFS